MFIDSSTVEKVECVSNSGKTMTLKVQVIMNGVPVADGMRLFGLQRQLVTVEVEPVQKEMLDPNTGELVQDAF